MKTNGQYRVACDVGGTFTDVCFLNEETGKIHVAKTPTTPDPIEGVLKGIEEGNVALSEMALFSHGTTLATNALITRRFPPAVMVTTKGFKDVIEIRRGTRDDCWDTYKEMAKPYIKRSDRLVIELNDKFHKSSDLKKNLAENKINQMKENAIKEIKDASIKIAINSVKKIITTSIDKSKLDTVFQKNLEETKEELKKINS